MADGCAVSPMRNASLFLVLLATAATAGRLIWMSAVDASTPTAVDATSDRVQAPATAPKSDAPGVESGTGPDQSLAAMPSAGPIPALSDWLARWKAASAEIQPALLAEGVRLAAVRREALKALIMTDPRRALSLAVSDALRRELPGEVASKLEQRLDARGDLEVIAGCFGHRHTFDRWVQVDGQRYRAFVFGRRDEQTTKLGLPLHGILLDEVVALDENPARVLAEPNPVDAASASSMLRVNVGGELREVAGKAALETLRTALIRAESHAGPRVAASPGFASSDGEALRPTGPGVAAYPAGWTIGAKRVLFMKVDFSDAPGASDTDTNILRCMKIADRYFQDVSNGRCSMSATIVPTVLRAPRPRSTYTLTTASFPLTNEVLQLARAADPTGAYDPDRFDRWVILYSRPDRAGGGFATVGGAGLWYSSIIEPGVLIHELGHNQGLQHSHSWKVPAGAAPAARNGTHEEYGDAFDVMGTGTSVDAAHFNAPQKEILGYLDSTSVTTIAQSGTFRLYRHDAPDASGVRALKINAGTTHDYWLEYRRIVPTRVDQGPRLQNGVLVHWGRRPPFASGTGTYLLDLTPPADVNDAPLGLGQTFSDPENAIHVTPLGVGGDAPREYIDVKVVLGNAAGNRPPVVTPPAPAAAWVARTDVPVTTTGSDPDGDALHWYWNFGDTRVHAPAPTTRQRYLRGGTYTATVTASDGRGGATSQTLQVNVTDPLTTWTKRASLPGRPLSDVIFAENRFVAAGGGGVFTSPTGITWTLANPGLTGQSSTGLVFGNGRYVAVGFRNSGGNFQAAAAHSTNAGTWTAGVTPAGIRSFQSVAFGNGRFVAVGLDGKAAYSADGAAWTETTTGVSAILARVRYANGLFVAVGNAGSIITSPDGIRWTNRSVEVVGDLNIYYLGLAYHGGSWHAADVNEVRSSPDGLVWTKTAGNPALGAQLGVGFGGLLGFGTFGGAAAKLRIAEQPGEWSSSVTFGLAGEVPQALAEGQGSVVVVGYDNGGAGGMVYQAGTPDTSAAPPVIANQPLSQEMGANATVVLAVTVQDGSGTTYQWYRNGQAIAGATAASLTVTTSATTGPGSYTVAITNGAGTVTSNPAVVRAAATNPGRISNLAIRSSAGSGAQTLIVGVTIGGSGTTGTKPVLVRGVGPSLAAFGVTGALVDPRLEVYRGPTLMAANDNWAGASSIATAAGAVGAFGLASAASRDAAYFSPDLPGGNYTVQVSGVGGTAGIALAEIYDASPAAQFTGSTPRLVNVSARTVVGTGGDILIAGFTVSGGGSRQVLIRAVGPTLTAFGVTGVLNDPHLQLFAGTDRIGENDNWVAAAGTTFAAVGAFPLNTNSRDSALVVTLSPGSYTAHVSGVGGTTGVALVEVYEVP